MSLTRNISFTLEGHRILAGNLNKKQQAEVIKWVKENINILKHTGTNIIQQKSNVYRRKR